VIQELLLDRYNTENDTACTVINGILADMTDASLLVSRYSDATGWMPQNVTAFMNKTFNRSGEGSKNLIKFRFSIRHGVLHLQGTEITIRITFGL